MTERHRRAGSLCCGLLYLYAWYYFNFHPVEQLGGLPPGRWLATTSETGDPIITAGWIMSMSVGFLLVGLMLLAAGSRNHDET